MYSVQVKTKQQLNLSERLNFVMKVLMMHHLLMSYVLEHKVCFHHAPATVNLYHNNKQKHGIWRWGSAQRTFYSAHRDDCNSKIICLKSWNLLWKCSLLASYFCNYWSEVLKCFSFPHIGKHEVTSQETKFNKSHTYNWKRQPYCLFTWIATVILLRLFKTFNGTTTKGRQWSSSYKYRYILMSFSASVCASSSFRLNYAFGVGVFFVYVLFHLSLSCTVLVQFSCSLQAVQAIRVFEQNIRALGQRLEWLELDIY